MTPSFTSPIRAAVVLLLSAAFAIGGTIGLAALADANHWCCVHSWALAHGSGLVVLLLFGLLGFHIVQGLGVSAGLLAAIPQLSLLPYFSYVGGALGTFFFTQHFMWLGLGAGVVAVIRRVRGHAVQPFGVALVGLVVSTLAVTYWVYLEWLFHSFRSNGG